MAGIVVVGAAVVAGILVLVLHIFLAVAMDQAIEDKGYGRGKLRVIGLVLCVLFGFCGCLYVAALPDTVSQDLQRKILWQLEKKS